MSILFSVLWFIGIWVLLGAIVGGVVGAMTATDEATENSLSRYGAIIFISALMLTGVGVYLGILPNTSSNTTNVDYSLHLGKMSRDSENLIIKNIKILSEKESVNKLTKSPMLKANLLIEVEATRDTVIETATGKIKQKLSRGETGEVNVTVMSSRKGSDNEWSPNMTIWEPDF